jgi:glyoxylase-like metal-dependent hydrolase (beta-lactamase superfamily II)
MNQYLLTCTATKLSALIDCGSTDLHPWISTSKLNSGKIDMILQTHGHVDHVTGLAESKKTLDVPIYGSDKDWLIYKSAPAQGEDNCIEAP